MCLGSEGQEWCLTEQVADLSDTNPNLRRNFFDEYLVCWVWSGGTGKFMSKKLNTLCLGAVWPTPDTHSVLHSVFTVDAASSMLYYPLH